MYAGRSLVFPQAIALAARPLSVPGRGNVLCASVIYVFRLSNGEHVKPSEWYEAVSTHGGALPIPDSMAPLPGAEVLVLGTLPPVAQDSRKAFLRCGPIERRFVLYRDPEAPGAPLDPGPPAARWHERDNPAGRGGPDDERPALIVEEDAPHEPLWLGLTPFDHPMRLRRIGDCGEDPGTGWPPDTDPAILHDAHEAFWCEALHPGMPLAFEGLGEAALETTLPPYRVSITSARTDATWVTEHARIHCVTLLPAADLGAVIWRAGIPLGRDALGETVFALIVALEDVDEPVKDAEHWGGIAADRWIEPETALDDRPLLPAALAASVGLPFSKPEGADPIDERRAAAEAWMREETGMPEENPFAAVAPEEANLERKMQEEVDSGDGPPDANAIDEMARNALAAAKRRHEEAGFKTPEVDPEAPREPQVRGPALDLEIRRRLSTPHASQREAAVAEQIRGHAAETLDADEVLGKMASARLRNPHPPLFWPALDEDESARFGHRLLERLAEGDLDRHIDISGLAVAVAVAGTDTGAADTAKVEDAPAALMPDANGGERPTVSGRRFDGLLAEETVWRGVRFTNCEFTSTSFAGGHFEDCEFEDCVFEQVNLSRATLTGCRFNHCTLRDLQCTDVVWMNCGFNDCTVESVTLMGPAMRDLEFSGGAWREVNLNDGLLVGCAWRGTEMREVTFGMVAAPHSRFERLSMFKVWVMGKGFPGSVFEEVEATTCGFLSNCQFDEARFERTRFVETGFSAAIFQDTHFAMGCQFDSCDLSSAAFVNTRLAGVRFLRCTMATSLWSNVDATEAWFFGSILRGVDFADTRLARAVFTDADIEGAEFQADKTIGADFRGTVHSTG